MMTTTAFLQMVNSGWRFRLFLLWKLPAALFMGVGMQHCDGRRAIVRLPYGWRSQNPFRSIYFAAQCSAAELSTGVLALAALQEKPAVSMLVTRIESEFYKKADKTLIFTCEQGEAVQAVIQKTIDSGEAQTLSMVSVATLPDGTMASRTTVTWSFRKKG